MNDEQFDPRADRVEVIREAADEEFPVVEPQAEATPEAELAAELEHQIEERDGEPSDDQGDPAKEWDDLTEREQVARLRAFIASTQPGNRITVLPESLSIVVEAIGNGQGGKAVTLVDRQRAESIIFRLMTRESVAAFVEHLTRPEVEVAGAEALAALKERERIDQHNLRVARRR